MLKALLDRLRLHSVARRGERLAWEDEAAEIRGEFLAYQMQLKAELEEHEKYKAEKETELAEIEAAMTDMDYAEAMADSFAGGPGSEGEGETE